MLNVLAPFSDEDEEVMASVESMEEGKEEEAKGKVEEKGKEEKVKGGDIEAGSEVWVFVVQIVMLGAMERVMPVGRTRGRGRKAERSEGRVRLSEQEHDIYSF